jgi:hypothetical protein
VRSFTRGRWHEVSRGKTKDDVLAPFYRGVERRAKARVAIPFPATVRGLNANGETTETDTHLNNLSAGGLHLRLAQPINQGANLFIIIWLGSSPKRELGTPRVAVRGIVSRVEPESAGAYGVAVAIRQYRFL